MIAFAIEHKRSLVISRGRERMIDELEHRERISSLTARIATPRHHGRAVFGPQAEKMAPGLHICIRKSGWLETRAGAIDGVAFGDSAEIHSHSLFGEKHCFGFGIDLPLPVIDEWKARFDLL